MPRKLCKPRKRQTPARGLKDGANNIDQIQDEVGYKEGNASMAEAKNDNIDCPYNDCKKKLKGERSFLKHLCLIHHRNELESKIIKMKDGKHGGVWNQNVHSVLFVHVYFKNVSYFCTFLKRNTNIYRV